MNKKLTAIVMLASLLLTGCNNATNNSTSNNTPNNTSSIDIVTDYTTEDVKITNYDDALGSIEYGVEHLHSPLVVVMGHEKCGAVTAAYDKVKNGTPVEGNINAIIDKIQPSITDAESLDEAIHDNTEAVKEQIENDEIVKKLVEEGKLKVVKAHYSLDGT